MAKLLFLLDGNSLGEFALDKERITIGRRPSNQIHIDNLAVSGEHAVIVTIGNDSFLEDLNSTNGTMVNGEAIKKHVLQHEDVIEFGKYQLKYINQGQAGAAYNNGFEKTMMLAPAKSAKTSKPAQDKHLVETPTQAVSTDDVVVEQKPEVKAQLIEDKPAVEKSLAVQPTSDNINTKADTIAANIARLQVLNGESSGRELLLNKTMTTLGKPGSQVAVITKRPNGYFITHVGGNSLPVVNGETIGVQAHALGNRDVIELAGTKMEFFLE